MKAFLLIIPLLLTAGVPVYEAGLRLSNVFINESNNIDSSDVLDDLNSSENFKSTDYTTSKKIKLVTLAEYGFSNYNNDNFSLYAYMYVPSNFNIDYYSSLNKIQLAINNIYLRYELNFINTTNNFVKFKVTMSLDETTNILKQLNYQKRIYQISGFELKDTDKFNATEYKVGGKFIYTGFAKGLNSNDTSNSTLFYTTENLETLDLNVNSTFYRSSSSSKGVNYKNQLNSVYFSIPNDILKEYGSVDKIKAEYYEYQTRPIIVANTNDYNNFKSDVGIKQTLETHSKNYIETDSINTSSDLTSSNYVLYKNYVTSPDIKDSNYFDTLNILFNGGDNPQETNIKGEELRNYLYAYKSSYIKGKDVSGVSLDLFNDKVDTGHIRGYNLKEFDTKNEFNLLSYDSTHSGWSKFWDYFGKWNVNTSDNFTNIAPIKKVELKDVAADTTGDFLLINSDDYSNFKTFFANESLKNNQTYIFRFSVTDYFSHLFKTYLYGQVRDPLLSWNGYYAIETVFLNFDIISLTFNKEGISYIMPCISNPVDLIADIIHPDTLVDWILLLKIILGIFLGIFILWVVSKIFSIFGFTLRDLFKLIAKPFKLLSQKIKNKRSKKK